MQVQLYSLSFKTIWSMTETKMKPQVSRERLDNARPSIDKTRPSPQVSRPRPQGLVSKSSPDNTITSGLKTLTSRMGLEFVSRQDYKF